MNKTAERNDQRSLMTIISNPLRGTMRRNEIHLSDPFEEVLEILLALPRTHAKIDDFPFPDTTDSSLRERAECEGEVRAALGSLYEAAHGRQVETGVGFVGIAPPVAEFLKQAPYYVNSQCEFFLEAFSRILTAMNRRGIDARDTLSPGSKPP